jgi:3-deoxy-manno-octulosonate cytidylyltransferase (CMP-KDO synthetase)
MKVVGLIPARMASSRFPGKPLALIHGKSMIEHVYRAVSKSPLITQTFIATCDPEIESAVSAFGGRAIRTGSHHERASDRCAEALEKLTSSSLSFDIAVMVQGDEPMTHPDQMAEVLRPFEEQEVSVVNLYSAISTSEAQSMNAVKVVIDQRGDALYFSRLPIPGSMGVPTLPTGKQLGLIAFRTTALRTYTQLSPTPYEISESVDMLRFIEHGFKIRMQKTSFETIAVDTPDDLAAAERAMSGHR